MRPYPCEAESAGPGGPRQRARAVVTASLQPVRPLRNEERTAGEALRGEVRPCGPASLSPPVGRTNNRPWPTLSSFFRSAPGSVPGGRVGRTVREVVGSPSLVERKNEAPGSKESWGAGAPCVAREHRPSQGRCHGRSVPRGSRWGQVWSGTDAEPAPAVQVSRSGYGCGVLPCGKGFTPRWAGAYPSPRPGPR